MSDGEGTNERTSLVMDDDKKTAEHERRRFRIVKHPDGERSLNMVLGVEDFRLACYVSMLFIFVVAYILTISFTTVPYHGIITSVYACHDTMVGHCGLISVSTLIFHRAMAIYTKGLVPTCG